MKLLNTVFAKGLLVTAIVTLTVACSQDKKKTDITAARPGDVVRTTGNPNTPVGPNGAVTNILNKGVGAISSSLTDQEFTNRVKMFLSATVNPDNVGDVSASMQSQTGVRFWLDIPVVGATNQLNMQSGQLAIAVYDSLTQQYGAPVTVKMGPGTMKQGTYSGNQLNVTFSDQYGDITLMGTNQGNLITGTVRYCNNKVVDTASWGPHCGELGQFQINTQDAIRQQ